MKIVFLCGSLEPGWDGVGDYTRRLACELIKEGHLATAIGINDTNISWLYKGFQTSEEVDLPVLRVPSLGPAKKRLREIEKWINDFDPDWISLQFVPFSFHPKGLPFRLTKQLRYLGKNRRWHFMFHELWVGMNKDAPKHYLFWGWLQRKLIEIILKDIQPGSVHTHTRLYQAQLSKIGCDSELLPLFANIPYQTLTGCAAQDLSKRDQEISFILFGEIHPNAPANQLAKEAAILKRNKGVAITLKILGRSGTAQKQWVKAWESQGLFVEVFGEQAATRISYELQSATIGISTTPLALIEKSGSVAAMWSHGLKVLCVSCPWRARGISYCEAVPGVYEYQYGKLEEFLKSNNFPKIYNLSDISIQLVNNLSAV